MPCLWRRNNPNYFQHPAALLALTVTSVFLQACSGPKQALLMPTPTLYEQRAIEPFPELPPEKQATHLQVFYASGREANPSGERLPYGNAI
jgi:hypothetical protein